MRYKPNITETDCLGILFDFPIDETDEEVLSAASKFLLGNMSFEELQEIALEISTKKDAMVDNIKVNAAAYGCAAVLDRYNPNDKELDLILEKIPSTWREPEYK